MDGIQMFHKSQIHVSFIHQQLNQIRECLKNIEIKNLKTIYDFVNIEKILQ